MQANLFNPTAPKKSANLSINSDLLRQAKEHHLNLSKALEAQLAVLLQERKRQQWQEENKEAINAYNCRIEENGTFSDGLRHF